MSKHRTRTTTDCPSCRRPITDQAYLCRPCTDKIAEKLGDIPALITDLAATYTRQTAGATLASHATETTLPWSEIASEAAAQLQAVLDTWMTNLGHRTHRDPILASRWLLRRVERIRQHPNAAACLDDLRTASRDIDHAMDSHAELWYAGPCRAEYTTSPPVTDDGIVDLDPDACCVVELYVKPGAIAHTCRNCSTVHDVEARRDWLLKQAEDQLAHAELIGRALASMGASVTPEMIRGYAFRGRIAQHGVDRQGRPTYRVGDVVEVVRQLEIDRTERATKAAAKAAMRRSVSA